MAESALSRSILGQPEAIRAVLRTQESAARAVANAMVGKRLWLVGTGTSYHAAQVGAYLFREFGREATAVRSFEFVNYPRQLNSSDAALIISHTGSTTYARESLAVTRRAGAVTVTVTGAASSLGEDGLRLLTTPPETSATYTVSYLAALTTLAMTAAHLATSNDRLLPDWTSTLTRVPEAIARTIAAENELFPIARELAARGRMILVGAGPNAATAYEGALKVKESSYLTAKGFEVEALLHSGVQAVQAGDVAVVIAANGPSLARTVDAVRALSLIGTRLLVVADERSAQTVRDAVGGATVFQVAHLTEALSPLVTTVPLQLLAAQTSDILGTNADDFRQGDARFSRIYAELTL